MKLEFNRIKPVWPWWDGVCIGLMVGVFVGAWLGREHWFDDPLAGLVTSTIGGLCIMLAYLPDMFVQLKEGVRRYREAAKH